MHPMLNIAIRAVRKAGSLITRYYENPASLKINQNYNNVLINYINCAAKHLMRDVIYKAYPQHIILNEKNYQLLNKNISIQWIIEPLSGTVNFIKRFPYFAISNTIRVKGRTEVAVIYDPLRNELFTASRGQGAQLNGYRLRGGNANNLYGAILATSFPLKQKKYIKNYLTCVHKLCIQCVDFRYTGSIALDLAYVAAGRIDGLFEIGIDPLAFIGGELLVREAGGLVTDFNGGHNSLLSGNIVAGNPHIVKAMLLILRDEFIEEL